MGWSEGAHPRVIAGTSSGGQFKSASASKSKSKSQSAASGKGSAKLKAAKKVRGRKTVTVKRGDTLSAIARRSGESLGQLKKDNPSLFTKAHRGGNLIFPGNKVKVRSAKKVRSSSTRVKKSATLGKSRAKLSAAPRRRSK